MSQSVSRDFQHFVFSTKERATFLTDPTFRRKVHAYMAGACKNMESPPVVIGGVADHVHVFCRLSKNLSQAAFVRDLKRETTKWIKANNASLRDFRWQAGYGAFSVSPSHVDALARYIQNQEAHHRKLGFQDEFRRLCKKYGADLDERYAWD
jgi:REP element-mobilizing transposase RayT